MTNTISWTKPKLAQFKKVYADAVGKGMDQFTFEAQLVVGYSKKYLIEYLDNRFKSK